MRPRLHVLLGGGGVGKTTLAASLAVALSRQGRTVGLLGIDPAKRLRTALGLSELDDLPRLVHAMDGRLQAAVLRPEQTLRRWAVESHAQGAGAVELFANPFFTLLADGLAASTDSIAAGRIVEWAEREPALDDLIVDTAPGLPALEFLGKPDKILALLDSKLFGWLGAHGRHGSANAHHWSIPRFLSGSLVKLAGLGAFAQIAAMVALMEACLTTFGRRVTLARDWFRADSTQILIVASAERTQECAEMIEALARLHLRPAAIVLNRALGPALSADGLLIAPAPAATESSDANSQRAFLAWVEALARQQRAALHALATLGVPVATAPRATLDGRNGALAEIGAALLAGLPRD